jgi:primase-polymerase (primpol)-like protein
MPVSRELVATTSEYGTQTAKPQYSCDLSLIEQNFPPELIAFNRWCLWRFEWCAKSRRWTKVPYQPNGRRAESDNRVTWSSFEDVCKAYRSKRGFDGIGWFLAEPYIGIDFDKCRDAATGVIELWAADAIALLNSYTEVSPRGTGIHVISQGELPPGRRRVGRVEIYQTGRYFTVTGVLL